MNQNKIVSFCFEYKAEILVSIIFAFCAFAFNTYRVEGDGLLYYGVLEKTLHIADPESSIDNLRSGFMQCGNVFFNIPFYLMGYLAEKAFHLKVNIDGVTLRTASINIASNFYLLLSLILCVRILKKLNLKNIILPCLCVLFSTSAYTVSTIMPSWNHSVDIFINTLFIYLFLMIELSAQKKYAIALGVVFISSILVRYFNFILIIPVIFYLIYKRDINNL
ncbi:MAG: hypothetical protein WCQ53_04370, partial [bacterium]